MIDIEFYKNKRVLITGHTGFKGSWLCRILAKAGAKVVGYSLKPVVEQNLFDIAQINDVSTSVFADIRDFSKLNKVFDEFQPEIVFHLAAQPIVRESYDNPVYTFDTNVMGTVHILECVRLQPCVKSFLNVTTDKVYNNKEWDWGYRENDELDGYDPYSNSKSCSELVTHSYQKSFFTDGRTAISTARAGNVIGGGDFAPNRIIPDCIRAANENKKIIVRNPYSIRPYQHVIEPLMAYLQIVEKQYMDHEYQGSYNVGPDERDCIKTGELVDLFCSAWGGNQQWDNQYDGGPHEAGFLKLDCSKIKNKIGWKPRWSIEEAINMVVQWSKVYYSKGNIISCMDQQIDNYFNKENTHV